MPPRKAKAAPADRPTWPATGPAVVTGAAGEPSYRMPTLLGVLPVMEGAVMSDRSAQELGFAFTEDDGTQVTYVATMTQDELFTLLWDQGLLERRVPE